MTKEPKNKSNKPSERKSSKKESVTPAPLDQGGEESKFRPRLRDIYDQKVVPALMKEFGYKNVMQVPRLERVVLNVGMGEAIQNVKLLEGAVAELGMITGQKPVVTRAKKAIAGFKLRQGLPIGTKVTLRSRRMYEFFDRLVTLALPRIRDFRGVSPKAFDGRGNYTLGVKEQLIFPEIKYDEVASIHGMDITVVTTARTNDEGKALLKHLGMPFRT
ncbi:MAG: 50S ribosomal protein L5 [Nitrospira sp.]|nr:50S ribosomal protein L5 [Nitrospira sp.]MDH4250033.1 50S ribosomal protein L5 [Nitrospira sp.]MDH4341501.1 50S ribosomal protein L5 [Nitrospira sp.]MDH5335110.1 50S ribosomal protein L5 [Nitrospira sp.]